MTYAKQTPVEGTICKPTAFVHKNALINVRTILPSLCYGLSDLNSCACACLTKVCLNKFASTYVYVYAKPYRLMHQDTGHRRRMARARTSVMPLPLPMTPTLAPGASGTLNMDPFFDSAPVTKPVCAPRRCLCHAWAALDNPGRAFYFAMPRQPAWQDPKAL